MSIPTLIACPYKPPKVNRAGELDGFVLAKTEAHGGPHPVRGWTEAPISWPWTICTGSRPQLIITPELERAVRTESVNAVCHHWRISRNWVERVRSYLEVPRMNPGTTQLWKDLRVSRLGDSIRRGNSRHDKITQAQADKIRARIARGERRVIVAEEFGLTRQYLSMLISGKRRKPVAKG